MKKILVCLMATVLVMPLWLSGCAPKVGGSDVSVGGARTVQKVSFGTVQSVREVRIEHDASVGTAVGTVGGAVVGGVLGSMVGDGRGRTLATMGGAIAGAGAGLLGAQALQSQTGLEITVRMDSGETIAVVQGADLAFSPGQRVQVVSGGDATRVTPI